MSLHLHTLLVDRKRKITFAILGLLLVFGTYARAKNPSMENFHESLAVSASGAAIYGLIIAAFWLSGDLSSKLASRIIYRDSSRTRFATNRLFGMIVVSLALGVLFIISSAIPGPTFDASMAFQGIISLLIITVVSSLFALAFAALTQSTFLTITGVLVVLLVPDILPKIFASLPAEFVKFFPEYHLTTVQEELWSPLSLLYLAGFTIVVVAVYFQAIKRAQF